VVFETCDARVLLTQIVGEFEEKTAANNLEMIVDSPKEAVNIRVDSRHIWRVFDNLLGNITKYAQPHTRVYISLTRDSGDAVISFKNISRYQLNISSEELMERFVRGDSSRNTEGSGLGLSIAQSLTALMNGTMELAVDGDLFKVTLRFPIVS
jgi:signal transduction histidine kinase